MAKTSDTFSIDLAVPAIARRETDTSALIALARLLGRAAAREFLATKPEPSTEPDGHATLRRTETKEEHHD